MIKYIKKPSFHLSDRIGLPGTANFVVVPGQTVVRIVVTAFPFYGNAVKFGSPPP